MLRFLLLSLLSSLAVCEARADKILVIGDSLSCGPFGRRVVENLKSRNHDVTLYCAVGSAPTNWLNGKNPSNQICQTMTSATMELAPCEPRGAMPTLTQLLQANSASRVIVALGTNSLSAPRADDSYKLMASTIKARSACTWIGPPHLKPAEAVGWSAHKLGSPDDLRESKTRMAALQKNLNSFYDSLGSSLAKACNLIDSRDVTASGAAAKTVDGVHRARIAGNVWADLLRQKIARTSPRSDRAAPRAALQ